MCNTPSTGHVPNLPHSPGVSIAWDKHLATLVTVWIFSAKLWIGHILTSLVPRLHGWLMLPFNCDHPKVGIIILCRIERSDLCTLNLSTHMHFVFDNLSNTCSSSFSHLGKSDFVMVCNRTWSKCGLVWDQRSSLSGEKGLCSLRPAFLSVWGKGPT